MTRNGDQPLWQRRSGPGPILAVANHHGHELRPETARIMALDEETRLREEDPYTGDWATVAPSHLIALRSRFEVDLNRPRETAVYLTEEDAWGLQVWAAPPPAELIEASLLEYDAYYALLRKMCDEKRDRYGAFVVLDLHSYNHRRTGPLAPAADPAGNPQVNIGTGTMDRDRWGRLVGRFIADLSGAEIRGRRLDVRENVKFVGRQFPKWVHTHYPDCGCAIAVEVKKFFMDEWTGALDPAAHGAVRQALSATLPGLEQELARLRA
jgi:N-formylglutamate deformylase